MEEVFLRRAQSAQLVTKLGAFYGTLMFNTVLTKARHCRLGYNYTNHIDTTISYLYKAFNTTNDPIYVWVSQTDFSFNRSV